MFLPFGWHVCSAERVRVSGCSYHLKLVACVQCWAGARERGFLPFGWHVCSAERVRVSGCSYHLAGMCAVMTDARERDCCEAQENRSFFYHRASKNNQPKKCGKQIRANIRNSFFEVVPNHQMQDSFFTKSKGKHSHKGAVHKTPRSSLMRLFWGPL